MCGIFGAVSNNLNPIEKNLNEILDSMSHRGPDERGIKTVDNVLLLHARLSIVGIQNGQQPISDDRHTLIYNGEIYNFRELNDKYKLGLFGNYSDTDVLFRLLTKNGIEVLSQLQGMFAFAFHDNQKNQIILARDRMGIKPLYYHKKNSEFYFSSEVKSMFSAGVKPELNEKAFYEHIYYRCLSGKSTYFKEVYELQPGELLKVDTNNLDSRSDFFWQVDHSINNSIKENKSEQIQEFTEALTKAVNSHLVSDVPIGTFNSGGVDSSLISLLAAQTKKERLNTFSIHQPNTRFDEAKYALEVAKHVGSNHHHQSLTPKEYSDLFSIVTYYLEEPVNHSHTPHLWKLFKFSRKKVTVVLTGEGADELFAGYPRYKIFYYFKLLLPLFKILNTTIFKRFLPVELNRKVDAFMNSVDSDINKRIILNSVLVNRSKIKDLFGVEFENKALRERLKIINTKSNKNYTNLTSLLQFEQKTYLKSLLNRLDKMSMAHSVESRVPFLDNELIDLSNRLSDEKKIFFGKSKWLIHKIAHLKLPEVIAKRKKMGFPTPINEWLRGNDVFFSYQDDIINNNFIMSKLKVNQLIHLMKEHNQGIKDHTDVLWPLFTFDQFMKVYNLDG